MRHLLALASLAALAGCVAPSAPAPQPARPAPVPPPPAPPPPAPVPPASSDWRDWPLTPGSWSYRADSTGSIAVYAAGGRAVFTLRCDRAGRQVVLARADGPGGPIVIRTSSTARSLSAVSGSVTVRANDPVLDAMGYSRGRFIVETPPLAPLVIPAWSEVLRVTEDCRR